ncbi:hypothetical protein F4604DRAFT_1770584 [Suillus subluteus]|nr:hypothetical protein F4604DRAFT_1770584 [Suillus subluteus]
MSSLARSQFPCLLATTAFLTVHQRTLSDCCPSKIPTSVCRLSIVSDNLPSQNAICASPSSASLRSTRSPVLGHCRKRSSKWMCTWTASPP